MVRMEEVAVKQGFLHLQQQQTFGKVSARLGSGRGRAMGVGEGTLIPGVEGIFMSLTLLRPCAPPIWTSPWGKRPAF